MRGDKGREERVLNPQEYHFLIWYPNKKWVPNDQMVRSKQNTPITYRAFNPSSLTQKEEGGEA